MPVHENCEYQRSYVDLINDAWEVVAVCRQQCSFNDYSSMVHDLGPEVFDDNAYPSNSAELEHERLVDYSSGNYRFAYDIVHEDGKLYVGDEIWPIEENDRLFELGSRD